MLVHDNIMLVGFGGDAGGQRCVSLRGRWQQQGHMSGHAIARHCPISLPDLLACRARRCCRRWQHVSL